MNKTKRGIEKRSKVERSKLQSEVNRNIWKSYTEEERTKRGRAISKSKIGIRRGKFSTKPPRSRKCGLDECENMVEEKITPSGLRKWNKYCCEFHARLGAGRNISKRLKKNETSEYNEYRARVYFFTHRNDLSTLDGCERRGKMRLGTNNTNLDHIFSIRDGFNMGIDPSIVGNINNLRFIHWKENRDKHDKSEITIEELLERIRVTKCTN